MSDRGYVNLVRHLTRATSTLPLETLQGSIAHYLARPPAPVPGTPTPLVATVLASPLFRPYTHPTLSALSLVFRHAVHLRVSVLKEDATRTSSGLLFSRDPSAKAAAGLGRWCRDVWEGFAGSAPPVRLACAAGLLLGLEDWEGELRMKEREARMRAKAEEEVVLALAEIVDAYAPDAVGWGADFKRAVEARGEQEDPLALAITLSSQCAPLITPQRLQALPLPAILDVLMSTIDRAFLSGRFLAEASAAVSINEEGKLTMMSVNPLLDTVHKISGSTYITSMASFAKFTSLALANLVESRPAPGWEAIGHVLGRLSQLTSTLESDWSGSPLSGLSEDADAADDTVRKTATATWQILKTLLFTTLMISQSALSAVVFTHNHASSSSPYGIALEVLRILSNLSFVMPQFGGVASASEGLPELKRAFYMALDVLSGSESEACRFVEGLCRSQEIVGKGKGVETLPRSLLDAKKAFALACVEQLVPILPESAIGDQVYPLCFPHLWDASHRETYESAHSVMLAIFMTHAQKSNAGNFQIITGPAFAEKIIPMYARCLVENSTDGLLSTNQLCMAYAALVRSTSAFGYADPSRSNTQADSLAWYCVEILLDAMRHARSSSTGDTISSHPSEAPVAAAPRPSAHLHRLHLTLVSVVASVSLALLPRLLAEVESIITTLSLEHEDSEEFAPGMRELVALLFKTISESVGDAEKSYAINWWNEHRGVLDGRRSAALDSAHREQETVPRPDTPDAVSRL